MNTVEEQHLDVPIERPSEYVGSRAVREFLIACACGETEVDRRKRLQQESSVPVLQQALATAARWQISYRDAATAESMPVRLRLAFGNLAQPPPNRAHVTATATRIDVTDWVERPIG